MDPPAQPMEESMDQKPTSQSIQNDVLHSTGHSKLSQEEIAKAIAHHNKNHPKEKLEMSGKSGAGKSPGGSKKSK
jgi:replication initiation and membrane attachment protein DnaB